GRSAVQPGRGAGAADGGGCGTARARARDVARTSRGLGGGAAAGGAVIGRARRSGAVRGGVLRQRADGGRIPAGGGAGAAGPGGAAGAAVGLGPRAGGARALLRTSVLERVSGPLADALTGGSGGERMLAELEQANAFVVSLDAGRSWFRYHHLFADRLQLALRRATPGEVTALHEAAAGWFAEHGFPVQAIRHAQAAQDWALAARLLADNWPGLYLGGQAATVHALLAGFPAEATAADAELATVVAADELAQGSLEEAERFLGLAARRFEGPSSVP